MDLGRGYMWGEGTKLVQLEKSKGMIKEEIKLTTELHC